MSVQEDRDRGEYVAEWVHSGLNCRVFKNSMGHYCGYVQSLFRSPWIYDDFQGWPVGLIDAHGGLTYGPDEDGWIGFDCAHAGDKCVYEGETWGTVSLPDNHGSREWDQTWTLEDVKSETNELAEQICVLQEFTEKALERGFSP